MQDRLKYRFWHKPTKKMLDCYGFNKDFVFGDTLDGVGTTYNPAKFEDCILMQCTGLKDKNGKLIYEGDIVNYSCLPGYSDIYACTFNRGGFLIGGLLISNTHLKSEVIGNIYENPELLEVSNDH